MKSKKHLYGAAYANSRARDENKIIGNVERATHALSRLLPGAQKTVDLHAIAGPLLNLVEVRFACGSIETVAATFLQSNASFCAELCSLGKRRINRRSTRLDFCQHPDQFPHR